MNIKQFLVVVVTCLASQLAIYSLPGCSSIFGPDTGPVQKLDAKKNYERDMIVTVNGVTREGAITMPLLPVNKIHIYAQGDLDTFLMEACGGKFKKQQAWNVSAEVPSGLFGWGSRKIDVKNEAEFTINASDFHDTGICPLNLVGISNGDGRHSEAFIAWQTPTYKATGTLVCNMQRRAFEGVEACSTATGSYAKLVFDEEMISSPTPGCDLPVTQGKEFIWRAHSGECNYLFEGKNSQTKAMYHLYGWDEITLR